MISARHAETLKRDSYPPSTNGRTATHTRPPRRNARARWFAHARPIVQGVGGTEAERATARLHPREDGHAARDRPHEGARQAAPHAGRRPVAIRGGPENREDD